MTALQLAAMAAVYLLVTLGLWRANLYIPVVGCALLGVARWLTPFDRGPQVIADPGEKLNWAYFALCFVTVCLIAYRHKRRWRHEATTTQEPPCTPPSP